MLDCPQFSGRQLSFCDRRMSWRKHRQTSSESENFSVASIRARSPNQEITIVHQKSHLELGAGRHLQENEFIESFKARLRDEPLDEEIFVSLAEAGIIIESWPRRCNTVQSHGSLGDKPPAPAFFIPVLAARAAVQRRLASPPH